MNTRDLFPWSRGRAGLAVDPFRAMRESMDEMLSRSGGLAPMGFGFGAEEGIAMPNLDIAEQDGALEVTVDVPGVPPENMSVSLENGVLTVSGHREDERTEGGKGKAFHRVERYRGHFLRRIALPAGIDEGRVEARHGNGVLTIRIPKLPEAEAKQKRIEIRTGEG